MTTIVTIADEKYFAYLRALVRSANANLSDVQIDCTLVNMDTESKDILERDHPSISVSFLNYSGRNIESFCTNIRTWLLLKARKNHAGTIVWLDATTIIRKPCDLLKIMTDSDVLVYEKLDKPGKHLTGFIGLSEKTNCFLETWDNAVSKDIDSWYANQDLFSEILKDFNLKIKDLPPEYLDWKFKDSFMWTGKGRKVRCDKRWKKEMKKWGIRWEYEGSNPEHKAGR